ncbi:MAG: hypothetical protein PVJ27_03225 [Candidatus Brocadiaceae bacterium]|jgi:hypothetical protein
MSAKRRRSGWSKEKIVNRIKVLHEKGEDLSYNRMARRRQGLLAAANYHFGGWGAAVNAAGLDYARDVRRIPKWTRDKIIEAIKEAYEAGEDLSWTSVTKNKDYSALAYAAIRDNQFGSWDDALAAAGIDPADVRRYESWDEDKIVRRIRERKKKGQPLNSKAMQEQASKLFNAALNYFEGWDKALEAAGIKPEDVYKRRRWSTKIIKKEIKELHRQGEDLAAPNMRKNHSSLYSAACKYFGTWTGAREACGIRRNYHKRRRK